MFHEDGKGRLESLQVIFTERPFNELTHPVTDITPDLVPGMGLQADLGQGVINTVGQIGDRIYQSAVEVKEDGFYWGHDNSNYVCLYLLQIGRTIVLQI